MNSKNKLEEGQEEFRHRKGSSSIIRYNLVDIRKPEEAIERGTAIARMSVIERMKDTEEIIEVVKKMSKHIKEKEERKEFAKEIKYLLEDRLTKEEIRKIIAASICNFFKSIPGFFQGIWESIKNFFINGWNSIISFFTETIPQWIQNIITWFQQLPYNIGLLIGQILGHILNFGLNVWNWVTVDLPQIIQGIIDWFAQLPGRIWEWLQNTINNIATWGQETWNTATTWVSNTINSIIDWFSKLPGRIWEWLTNAINNVINWGKDLVNKGKEAAQNLVDNIVNTIQNLPSKLAEIGKNLVQGLWNGITSAGDWLKDKISGFANGIIDGFKSTFKIHSPSKVMNKEIGRYLALGLGEGFNDNIKSVYSKMKSAVEFETQKLSASLSTTATTNKTLTANITVNPSDIYMDSTKVGRVLTPAVTKTLRGAGAY